MDNRLILPLLCAASAVAFAAAPFPHEEKSNATVRHHAAENAAPIVTTFDITRPKNDTEKLRFTLSVKNNTTKMLELRFPDGEARIRAGAEGRPERHLDPPADHQQAGQHVGERSVGALLQPSIPSKPPQSSSTPLVLGKGSQVRWRSTQECWPSARA